MNRIDEAIYAEQRKRKWVVLGSASVLSIVLCGYLAWLFLLKGFTVQVLPAEAATSQQFSVEQGAGFFIDNTFYLLGAEAQIRISAHKYAAKTLTVVATQDSQISVTLDPMPASVDFVTAPTLEDINWRVNGQLIAQTARFQAPFAPGRYEITAEHPFYQPNSVSVSLLAGDAIQQTLSLTPVAGQLQLSSRPSGALISINGASVGQTPLTLSQSGGAYAVTITLAGYEPVTETITLSYQQPRQQRDYFLRPEQATLQLQLSPSDGILLVNGQPVTPTAQQTVRVEAGKAHTLRYEKAGYLSQSQRVQLNAGQQQTLTFALTAELGEVQFSSNEVAEVWINGQRQGQTPITLSLPSIAQQVEFRKTGYRTVQRTVTPSARQVQRVRAELKTEFAARRAEGQALFSASIGIQFIAVQLKPFTMGSPPNETDRGRNEHAIPVSFSRNILVSAHEITEAQYAAFQGGGSASTLPVTQVSWLDAVKFCNWLSEQEGLEPFYTVQGNRVNGIRANSTGYRLLTEAEWEFIAKHNRRAARTTYVWGNEERLRAQQGNFADSALQGQQPFFFRDYQDGFAGKAPVGSFKAERAGFFDLDGNVREWVHDSYTLSVPNTTDVQQDYVGPAQNGQSHVVKGASFKSGRLKELRASIRAEGSAPADDIGFRIARYE